MTKLFYQALTFVAVAGALTLAAQGQTNSGQDNAMGPGSSEGHMAKLSPADQKFVKEAAQGGLAEVELGQLAVQKASSDAVKNFGQRMVDDHSKANDKLKELASEKGINLPKSPSVMQKATKERLSKLSGDQFDKAYMSDMLKDHKKDVAAFRTESSTGQDSDVKNFATQTLPTLREHLKAAESIAPKSTQAANSSLKPSPSQP
ncbi:MAG TPA: DUF4142 domain-containing protein [Candidatus Sulfotelmatobacter sp.]|jgi:putative membrane protein